MPWSKINFAPGITKDVTRYGSEGTWVDANLVRFRNGYPERWAGWTRYYPTAMEGICRSLHRWSLLAGSVYTGFGTHARYYVESGGVLTDITPLRTSAALTNPYDTTSGSNIVVVTHVNHGALTNDYIRPAASATVGGVTISGWYRVTFIDNDHYSITVSSNATSTVTGGGSITIEYLYMVGDADYIATGDGWGSGPWNVGTWGSSTGGLDRMGLWSQDNWGEDLVANVYEGPIFYWDASAGGRMVNIRDLPGADGYAPSTARLITVSHKERFLLAFGVGEEWGGSTAAPMTVRWCSQEDIYNWNEADATGSAGSLPLSHGSQFIAVQQTGQEILVWSDTALYSLQFVGAPDVYVANLIATNTDIAGKNASTAFGGNVYWLGPSGFYAYDGRARPLPSTVWDFVSRDLNWQQSMKIYASTNRTNNEVIWFYQSTAGTECDSYVAYDVVQNIWTTGRLDRTAWLDMSFQYPPLATNAASYALLHGTSNDDESGSTPVPLNAYLESAPLELSSEGSFDKGDRFVFIRRILPDVTFLSPDGSAAPKMNIVIKMMDKPGGGFKNSSSSQVSQGAIIPVEQFTEDCHVRLRGRSMTVRFESNTLNSMWRVGNFRYDMRTDGQR